jgi:hypothetical protein
MNRFFLNYQRGKCRKQPTGINKFGNISREIAEFLKFPQPASYTGHCLRRSSATILVDSGANITALKRHGGWRSTTVAEGYIDHSLQNKVQTADKILHSIENSNNSFNATTSHISNDTSNNSHSDIAETENIDSVNINFDTSNSCENNVGVISNTSENENMKTSMVSFSNCKNFSNVTINVHLPK